MSVLTLVFFTELKGRGITPGYLPQNCSIVIDRTLYNLTNIFYILEKISRKKIYYQVTIKVM